MASFCPTSEFKLASEFVRKAKGDSGTASNEEKLKLYSLYKQGTSGDVTGSQPWAVQLEARAKYDAHAAVKGMTKETAQAGYIAEVLRQMEAFSLTCEGVDWPPSKAAGQSPCCILPSFTVLDQAKVDPILAEFVEKTKTEAGCLFYGWTQVGDQLRCREAYVDGAAMNAHLDNVGPLIGKLLADGVAKLDRICIDAPAAELEAVTPGTKDLGTTYFADSALCFSNIKLSATEAPYTFVSIHPSFTVLDQAKADPILAEFAEKTKTEAGCLFYGWTQVGDQLHCREAYVDGAAANVHLDNVGPCIGKLLADGIAKLDSIEIHGPAAELEVVKPGTKDLGTTYFVATAGFAKFA